MRIEGTDIKETKTFVSAVSGVRLDVFLSVVTGFTRSRIKQLIDAGHIFYYPCKPVKSPAGEYQYGIAPSKFKSGETLKTGDKVIVEIPGDRTLDLSPENIPVEIVYEDEYLAVVNKPQGLTVHPAGGSESGTLVNALLYKLNSLSSINGAVRPGIVHRLDKNTSGLLVIAKTDEAHLSLSRQIAEKTAVRIYHAVLEGVIKEDSGTVNKPVGRDLKDRKKMAVTESGRAAVTHYRVLKRFDNHTYAEFRLETGRTHQIRVHAKHLGHPVVGDIVYGFKNQRFKSLSGQLLHAKELSFVHPVLNQAMTFKTDLPDYFVEVLRKL